MISANKIGESVTELKFQINPWNLVFMVRKPRGKNFGTLLPRTEQKTDCRSRKTEENR